MEEKVEEIKIREKVFRAYKIDYVRLEKRQAYKLSAFPKVENIGHELECGTMLPAGTFQYTHFVSIPLIIYKNVTEQYGEFKKAVLSDKEIPIDPAFFNPENHLHLTIAMLVLNSKEKIDLASKALMQAWDKIVEQKLVPIKLNMKGVETFGKKIDKTNIVYGKLVENSEYEKLIKIGNIIIKQLIEMKALEKDELTHITYYPDHDLYKIDQLHMTILNTKFKAKTVAGSKEKQFLFDASNIVKYYGDFNFGEFELQRIEISKKSEYNKENGYYLCEQFVPTDLQKKS